MEIIVYFFQGMEKGYRVKTPNGFFDCTLASDAMKNLRHLNVTTANAQKAVALAREFGVTKIFSGAVA